LQLPGNYTGTLVETATTLEVDNLIDLHSQKIASSDLPTSGDLPVAHDSLATPSELMTVNPTPEPGSVALLALGGAALLGRRRRARA
jgi:hypothetical protein